MVWAVGFWPDGRHLAVWAGTRGGGELTLWDAGPPAGGTP